MRMKNDNVPYPTADWFSKRELDEKTEIFEYDVNGKSQKVAFDIRSLTKEEILLIEAKHTEIEEDTKMKDVDFDAVMEERILTAVSFKDKDGKKVNLDHDMLMAITKNKKSGLYDEILRAVLNQSKAKIEAIESQKN